MRICRRLVTYFDDFLSTSPKHIFATNRRFVALMNLSYVTARVSHGRRHYMDSNVSDPQGLRRPRFSFFRFNCQTAKTRQTELSEQHFHGPALILSLPGPLDRAILGLKRREKDLRQPFKAACSRCSAY